MLVFRYRLRESAWNTKESTLRRNNCCSFIYALVLSCIHNHIGWSSYIVLIRYVERPVYYCNIQFNGNSVRMRWRFRCRSEIRNTRILIFRACHCYLEAQWITHSWVIGFGSNIDVNTVRNCQEDQELLYRFRMLLLATSTG